MRFDFTEIKEISKVDGGDEVLANTYLRAKYRLDL